MPDNQTVHRICRPGRIRKQRHWRQPGDCGRYPTKSNLSCSMNFTRVPDHRKHVGVFESCIGSTLQSLTFAQYHFNGEPSGNDIGSLELGFSASRFLLLSLASDGETVTASHGRLVIQPGFTLGEDSGFTTESGSRCDWLRTECDNGFIGQRLVGVQAQIDRIHDSDPFTSGWILRFDSGFIGYHNFCDDLTCCTIKSSTLRIRNHNY